MPSVLYTGRPRGRSFRGPRYGVGGGDWCEGECRQMESEQAEQLMTDFPGWFEVKTAAAATPAVDRSVKSPAKKTKTRRAAVSKTPRKTRVKT
mgnify:CR=1 FL=1